MNENLVIYDALSFTTKIHSIANILDMLGLAHVNWLETKGSKGYQNRMYYDCISIHYNGAENMGIWVELTGQGCRAFETYGTGDYEALFSEILSNEKEMNLTRLDVAYDDHKGIIDINQVVNDTRGQLFVSRFNDWQVIEGNKGCTVNHGSMKSEIFIRIYDKAAERGFIDKHWIRLELQLRRERALAFIKQKGDIGEKFGGVLLNYLRYLEPDGLDNNKWRWGLSEYWSELLKDAVKISLYQKPGTDYNLNNLNDFVFKQAGNAIDAALKIHGEDDFFKLLKKRQTAPNAKYTELIGRIQANELHTCTTHI